MDYTPIPGFNGYFMLDAVGVYKKKNDEYIYVKPYPRKNALDYYVNLVRDGRHATRSLASLARVTFGRPAYVEGTPRRLPDFPTYECYEFGAWIRVFLKGVPVKVRETTKRKEPYYVLTDYAGARKAVAMSVIHTMFVNAFDPDLT